MKARKVIGLSVAVIENHKIAWAKGYGLKDVTVSNDSVNTETLFQCASIGKVITALAVMRLVSEQKIALDEDINLKLSSWKITENSFTAQKKVTLRMLLSHSAGLKDNYGFEGYYPNSTLPSLLQILNAKHPANNRKKLTIETVPGTTEQYSGGGYLIIQQLIEDLSGMSFANYCQQYIFTPLEMTNTTYVHHPDTELKLPLARGHEDDGKVDPKRKYNDYPELAAAGPWTTATDLAKLIIAIQNAASGKAGPLPDSNYIKQMLNPQINAMGLGMHLKGATIVQGFWHSGNNAGYTGIFIGLSETGQGAVVLTNSNAGEWMALEVIRSIADTYNWPIMQSITELPIQHLDKYSGIYKVGDKEALLLTADKDKLYFQKVSSKVRYQLYYTADGFRMKEKPDNLKFTFEEDPNGNIISITLHENAGTVNSRMTKAMIN